MGPGSEPGALPLQPVFPLAPRGEVSELTCKRSAFEYFSCVFPAVSWKLVIRSFRYICWRRKWQPTPVFLPGESQGRGAWWAAVYEVAQSRTQLKRLSSSSSSTFVDSHAIR